MATLNRTFSVKNGIDVANTIIVDGSRNLSNIATANATTVNAETFITTGGLNVTDQANNARNQANTARDQANTAYGQANDAFTQANTARDQANTGYGQANAAYLQANTARDQANTARDTANDAYTEANTAHTQADAARATANDAYGAANTAQGQADVARTTANDAYGAANTAQSQADVARDTANDAYGAANTAQGQADVARGQANTARDTANGAYAQANGAYSQANGAYAQANGAYASANGAYAQANGAYTQANGAYSQANVSANTVRVYANSAGELSNKFLNFVNTASIQVTVTDNADGNANISFITTGAAVADAYAQANAAYGQANDAYGQANAAYGEANLKLNLTGGTITGSLVVQGNLEILGNSTTLNVETLAVEDNEIILNSNVNGSPALDGLITINRGSETNAVLKWDESSDQWKWADGEGTFYAFDAALDAYASANAGYAQANTARSTANDAYGQANTARTTANDSYAQANTARTQANTARDQANTAYGQANDAYGQANTARAQANAGYAQANAAYADANTRVLKSGDTMTGVLTITNSGFGLAVGNAAVTYELSVGSLNVTTNTVTTSATGQVVLDTFATTEHASAKYFVQVKSGSAYHTTEVVLVQDATNVWLTEYGSIQTGASLGSFSADISSGDVRLLFNADNAVNTIRSVRYGVAPP